MTSELDIKSIGERSEIDNHNNGFLFRIVSATNRACVYCALFIRRWSKESACCFDACRFRASHDLIRERKPHRSG